MGEFFFPRIFFVTPTCIEIRFLATTTPYLTPAMILYTRHNVSSIGVAATCPSSLGVGLHPVISSFSAGRCHRSIMTVLVVITARSLSPILVGTAAT